MFDAEVVAKVGKAKTISCGVKEFQECTTRTVS
jgi:hypothetical protein